MGRLRGGPALREIELIHEFRYGLILPPRPVLICTLEANGRTEYCISLVDSGADHCVFPLALALRMGFEPEGQPCTMIRGLIGSPADLYLWEVTLKFDFGSFRVTAGFSEALDRQDRGYLGQNGFFDNVRVVFDRRANRFTIEPY